MSLSVSPPVRIMAFLGLAAALALGAGFMLMGRKSDSVAAPAVVIKHHPFGPGASKKTTPSASHPAKAGHAAKTARAVKPAPIVRKAPEKPAAEVAALAAGLPAPLARALGQSPVVVVELTDPQSEVDAIAFAEAKAGAELAGVPFVPLNVLDQAQVGKLTEQFGQVLPDPGLFVYRRPATIALRIDGFADRDTVAQAAHDAAMGLSR